MFCHLDRLMVPKTIITTTTTTNKAQIIANRIDVVDFPVTMLLSVEFLQWRWG